MIGFSIDIFLGIIPAVVIAYILNKTKTGLSCLFIFFLCFFFMFAILAFYQTIGLEHNQANISASAIAVLSGLILWHFRPNTDIVGESDNNMPDQNDKSPLLAESKQPQDSVESDGSNLKSSLDPTNSKTEFDSKKVFQFAENEALRDITFEHYDADSYKHSAELLTKDEAIRISKLLTPRYPRLNFEVKDFSDKNDPFAPVQVAIIAKVIT